MSTQRRHLGTMNYLLLMFTLRKLTRAGWKISSSVTTPIRLIDSVSGWTCCPITAACLFVTGRLYGVERWEEAAIHLNFYSQTVSSRFLMVAADGKFGKTDVAQQVRTHLRYFLGLPKE